MPQGRLLTAFVHKKTAWLADGYVCHVMRSLRLASCGDARLQGYKAASLESLKKFSNHHYTSIFLPGSFTLSV